MLFPRKAVLFCATQYERGVNFLEKYVLGLDYEVRGLENIPKDTAYIVAAKHQSAYETLKLHCILDDPAVVLKKELLSIPLWGPLLSKLKPVAIDRSQSRDAIVQIIDAAMDVKNDKRPLVIFPQGTRVYPWQTPQDKPYKNGVIRIYEKTELPIVPMAVNSGLYWPRKGWIKRPGKVIFEFLPVINAGQDSSQIKDELPNVLEAATLKLQDEAVNAYKHITPPLRPVPES